MRIAKFDPKTEYRKVYDILFCIVIGLALCIYAAAMVCFVTSGDILALLSAAAMILHIAFCFILRRAAYAG